MNSARYARCAAGIFAVAITSFSGQLSADEKPNLLIITVDDMNADSLGCYGCQLADTSPQIDAFAKRCLRFQYAHVQVGNCMPSRNVMWSGKYPHNNRVEGFFEVKDIQYPVLADLMRTAGYFTAIRHKVAHSTPYSPYNWNLVLDNLPDGSKAHVKHAASYGDSTERAIKAAKEQGKSFCLMINVADPHKPFHAQNNRTGETIPDKYPPTKVFEPSEVPVPGFLFDDPVVRKELAHYYSSVRRADDCVGEVLRALNESGEADKTVIVFLSDHGMPLPFAKTQVYHHSTRTPLMVYWPGVTKPGNDEQHMVSAVDLLPTLLDILGAEHPSGLDGRSFASILKGETQDTRDFVIKEYNENSGRSRDPMRAIQTKEYLYIFNAWSNGERVMATATTGTPTYRRLKELANTDPKLAARNRLYQFRVVEELFNVENDPDCLHNMIADSAAKPIADDLRRELEDWMKATNDHILPAFQQRDNADAREAYVLEKEAEASKRPRKNKQNTKKAA